MILKIEKFCSLEKGNGLRATTLISPGELLYTAEPFVYTVDQIGWGKVCEFCLCEPPLLRRCSRCKFAKYCTKSCQAGAWPEHQLECVCLGDLEANVTTHTMRLFGKIVLKRLQKKLCPSEELFSVSELVLNYSNQKNKEIQMLSECYADTLQLYLENAIQDPSQLPVDLFAESFCMGFVNGVRIVSDVQEDVAYGLYPSMSLLNHSCVPNCFPVFKGRQYHLRAIKTIQPGEELTISYVNPLMPTEARQHELRRTYSFECDCYRCHTRDQEEIMLAGDQHASDETKDLLSRMKLQGRQKWDESLVLCKTQLAKNRSRLPDENIYQLEILEFAMDACIELNRLKEALQYGLRTIRPYRIYHVGISTTRAFHICKVGKLQVFFGNRKEGLENLKTGLDILNICYPRDHRMMQEYIRIFKCYH